MNRNFSAILFICICGSICAGASVFSSSRAAAAPPPPQSPWEKLAQLSKTSCPPDMAFIPPGHFDMGCSFDDTQCQPDERPVVSAYITRAFCMDRREVTEAKYAKVTHKTIRYSQRCGFDCPVTNVSWYEAKAYCEKTGGRLPTEAEWEYSARALTTYKYYWGSNMSGDYAWYNKNSKSSRHTTGKKRPNRFGLQDMLGNAWEWVQDCYDERWYRRMPHEAPLFDRANCEARVLRGGAGYADETQLRVSKRIADDPEYRNEFFGFRCAKNIP